MRKWLKGAFFFLLFLAARQAFAFEGRAVFRYTLPADKTIHTDLYVMGWNVDIKGTVDGDLVVLGGIVRVQGAVHGNLFLSGGRVEVTGPVSGEINVIALSADVNTTCQQCRMLALDTEEKGIVSGDLLEFGVMVYSKGKVLKDTLMGGDDLSLAGTHMGKFLAYGKRVVIKGIVAGNTRVTAASSVHLSKKGFLMGNLIYTSPSVLEGKMKHVTGKIIHYYPPPRFVGVLRFPWIYTLLHSILSAVWLIVVGLFALSTWLKRPVRIIMDGMLYHPWESFLFGVVICLTVPTLGVILMLSILGLPLGFIMLSLFAIGVYVTRLFVSLWIGERVLGRLEHHRPPYWQSLPIGVLLFTVLTSIPYLGVVFSLITIPLPFGARVVVFRRVEKQRQN
jgi:cytoskeletal protein CcmA (bactofilin family)